MITHHFSRPLAILSMIATLATGIALFAPSTARAETGNQIIMSDGNIDCPPCRLLQIFDQGGLSFRDLAAEVQDDNEVVITAEVAVAGTAGRARVGSVVFSSFMEYSDDANFMGYTDDVCIPSLMSRQAGDQACAAIARAFRDAAAAAATSPAVPTTAPPTPAPGIIMRDGGICDPIRHMGC